MSESLGQIVGTWRRRLLGAGCALALGATVPAWADASGDDTNGPVVHHGPCVATWSSKEARDDPDLDITKTRVQLTAKALIVTISVAKLAEHPMTDTGHEFSVSFGYAGHNGRAPGTEVFGDYVHDAATGTSAYNPDSPIRAVKGTRVRFDIEHSLVRVTMPRHALYAQMTYPALEPTVGDLRVDARAYRQQGAVGGGDITWSNTYPEPLLSFAACDRALGAHPTPVPLDPTIEHLSYPDRCTVAITDPLGDADSRDDLDIQSVTYRRTKRDYTVTINVPSIQAHPQNAWAQQFGVALTAFEGADGDPSWDSVGLWRGSTGSGTSGDGPLLGGRIDEEHHLVVIHLKRSALSDPEFNGLRAFSSDTYVKAGPYAIGETFAGDANAVPWTIDNETCDRYQEM